MEIKATGFLADSVIFLSGVDIVHFVNLTLTKSFHILSYP